MANVGNINVNLTATNQNLQNVMQRSIGMISNTGSKLTSIMSNVSQSISNSIKTVLIYKGLDLITDGLASSVRAFNIYESSMMGFGSIINGQGRNFAQSKAFIDEYIADGLVPLSNAVTAYKNLATRGYSDEQIKNTLNRLKDASAFGRRASLSMGMAVETASEGLRNENSILVDNSGITKNVSAMWADYAKKIGVGAKSLTKAQKIQAEVNGIMEESKFQVGDAAKYSQTLGGRMAAVSSQFTMLSVAIGSALAPILMQIIPIIATVTAKLTQMFNTIASVTKSIFGSSGAQKKSVETTNSAAAAQTNLGNETKKAGKKAKKGVAGFDEINQLQEDLAENADDAAEALSNPLSPLDASAGEEANPIEIPFKLPEIDFNPLTTALDKLKKSLEPFTNTLFDGLKWFWENILIPLAEWTLQEAVPAFLNLLSGALDVLNPLLTAFKPIGEWLWINFLQPIAAWTGGVIVGTLNNIGTALTSIGTWMTNNQDAVTKMEIAIGAFMAAWKLTELMAFIQMSGGVITALTRITTAIVAGTLAKLADKAETIALTALYAKDFIMSIIRGTASIITQVAAWIALTASQLAAKVGMIATTIAQTAMTIASGIWNAICGVATAVQWLWNAAMYANPIGLVILAVVALIAIIVLLVKNWDTVKWAAEACWNWIKEAWVVVAEWFNTWVIKPIAAFFVALWEGIKTVFAGIGAWFSTKFSEAWTAVTSAFSAAGTWVAGVWKIITDAFSAAGTWFGTIFADAWTAVTGAFSAVGTFFGGIWETIKSTFVDIGTKIGGAVGSAFKTAINSVLSTIENIINGFFDLINGSLEMINKIPGVNIGKIEHLKVPRLATGTNYVPQDMLAMIHQGEAVVPKKYNQNSGTDSLIQEMGVMLANVLMTTSQLSQPQQSSNGTKDIVINVDGAQLAKIMLPKLDKERTRVGGSMVIQGI